MADGVVDCQNGLIHVWMDASYNRTHVYDAITFIQHINDIKDIIDFKSYIICFDLMQFLVSNTFICGLHLRHAKCNIIFQIIWNI